MRYVVVGNSAAAVHAAESVRRHDPGGEILMFSREPYLAYSRPLIAEYLFDGVPERRMGYRDDAFYRVNAIELRLGTEVVAVDPKVRTVRTRSKETFPYDRLFLGTGGIPFIPPIPGIDRAGVHTLMTWDQAKAIKEEIKVHRKAVVLGGGLIGMKAAEGLFAAGVGTTIVELAPQVLGRILDREGAAIYEAHLRSRGMAIVTGDTIASIEGKGKKGRVERLRLRSGRLLECDLLIVGVGVVPNTELAKTAGAAVRRGIVVDDRMETSVTGIYAGGDAVESRDVVAGSPQVNAIWPIANAHGKVAGTNMAGGERTYPGGIAKNALRVAGLDMISAGIVDAPPDPEFCEMKARRDGEPWYRKFVFRGNRIVGGMFVGEIDKAGIVTGLIENAASLEGDRTWLLTGEPALVNIPRPWREAHLARPVVR